MTCKNRAKNCGGCPLLEVPYPEQLKQKECEKECEPEADKTAVGETSEEKSTDAAESAAETKQEEGDAQ